MSDNKQSQNVIIKSRIFRTFIGQLDHMTASSYMNDLLQIQYNNELKKQELSNILVENSDCCNYIDALLWRRQNLPPGLSIIVQ